MGCGKRALCREQQASLVALVQCKSPSKECLRLSVSIRPSGLPQHLGMWVKRRRWASGTHKNFLIQEEEWFMPPGQYWIKEDGDDTFLKSVKAVVYELYTQPAVVSFTHRSHQHGKKKDPNTSLELASWYGQALWQSEHVVSMGAHAENKDHLCLYTTVAKIK